jgi:hypothetical protein
MSTDFLKPWLAKNPGPFKVGDRVSFETLGRRREGVVVEDRGYVGIKGERVYAVRVREDEWNEIVTEFPVGELQLVAPAPKEDGDGRKS